VSSTASQFHSVASVFGCQATVPGEQGAWCHDPVSPQVPGQQSCQRSEHTAIGPVRLRAGDLAPEYRDLMPQHQDLQVFRGIAAGEQRKPRKRAGHGEAYEAEEHERRG